MIRYLTFKIVLHDRHNNFYALAPPSYRDQRQTKQRKIEEIDAGENGREQNTKAREKKNKNYRMIPPTVLSPTL